MTRVLLLWPGSEGPASGNFGVPQLVGMATYARKVTGAEVVIRDLAAERLAFGPVDLDRLLRGEGDGAWDIIAFSVYSSFDYLKCLVLAELARACAGHGHGAEIVQGAAGGCAEEGRTFCACTHKHSGWGVTFILKNSSDPWRRLREFFQLVRSWRHFLKFPGSIFLNFRVPEAAASSGARNAKELGPPPLLSGRRSELRGLIVSA